jgi:hypothetical protein
MEELARVRLSGDLEGDYVVLHRHAGGVLRIAPEQPDGHLKVVALKKTPSHVHRNGRERSRTDGSSTRGIATVN